MDAYTVRAVRRNFWGLSRQRSSLAFAPWACSHDRALLKEIELHSKQLQRCCAIAGAQHSIDRHATNPACSNRERVQQPAQEGENVKPEKRRDDWRLSDRDSGCEHEARNRGPHEVSGEPIHRQTSCGILVAALQKAAGSGAMIRPRVLGIA